MRSSVNPNEKMYTPTEVAQLLQVHKTTIHRRIRAGELSAIAISQRGYRIPESSLVKYLTSLRRGA